MVGHLNHAILARKELIMEIPYGFQSINDSDIEAVSRALNGRWLTTGPAVDLFEEAISKNSGTIGAVAVSNGTAALHSAYRAIKLQPGDEIITTPLTFVATASMAMAEGAKVVFADVEEDTGNINPESVESLITSRTKAVVGVDFAGHPVEVDELRAICEKHNIYFILDASHSLGSTYRGRPVGSDADISTFSFFPTKNITTGEGGALVSSNSELLNRARLFRSHGMIREKTLQRLKTEGDWHQEVQEFGFNYRIPDILCALGISQISRLGEFKAKRQAVFANYIEALQNIEGLTLPAQRNYVDPMWHLFPIRVEGGSRSEIFSKLRNSGIKVQVNYLPVHWHPVFEDLGYRRGIAPNAERYYQEEISLPMYSDLDERSQGRVIDTLVRAINSSK